MKKLNINPINLNENMEIINSTEALCKIKWGCIDLNFPDDPIGLKKDILKILFPERQTPKDPFEIHWLFRIHSINTIIINATT